MKKVFLFVSTGILFTIPGCSGNSQKVASRSTPAVVQASTAPNNPSPVGLPVAPLPLPSVQHANQHVWQSEIIKDHLFNSIALKEASLDGQFDLVIVQKGSYSFLSFARHARWESVHNRPATGKLMYLRVKFEDGEEKGVEWDELGFATKNLCGVLWSYPADPNAGIGAVPGGASGDSVGGDQLLLQDMTKHKAMLLEVEPGVTTQFDLTGLAHELEKIRTPKTQPVLAASQGVE